MPGPTIQTICAGFFAEVLAVFRVQNFHSREFAADCPVEVSGGIMRVNHIDLFSAREARNSPEEPPIHAGFLAERDDARCLTPPGSRLFQTTNDEPEFL